MLRKIKLLGLSLSFFGSIGLLGFMFLAPTPALAAPVNCVPVCDYQPCFCPSGQSCVIWVSPTGGPCFRPNTNCWTNCFGHA